MILETREREEEVGKAIQVPDHVFAHRLGLSEANHRPLGAILVDLGYADEEKVLQVLGTQLRLLTTSVDPYEVDLDVLRLLPRRLAIRNSLFPVEVSEKGVLLIATDRPLQPEDRQQVESALGRRVHRLAIGVWERSSRRV